MGKKLNNVPVTLDDAFLAKIDAVADKLEESRSAVMRRALRAGLPVVESGAKAVVISPELTRFVSFLAERFQRTEQSILAEAVERGIRAVELHALIEQARKEGTMPEGEAEAILKQSGPDAYPEQRAVREAIQERGRLAIQLDDLLRHCADARERKELIEKHTELMRKRYGTSPSMWGSGVDTEQLKKNIALLEAELAAGKGPDPQAQSLAETMKTLRESTPSYAAKHIGPLPVTLTPAKPARPGSASRAKKKSRK